MIKFPIILEGPLYSQSGYGERFRFLVQDIQAFCEDVSVYPTKWGKTLNNAKFENVDIISEIPNEQKFIYIQCTVPNEFKPKSTYYNIGVTAGIETDTYPSNWWRPMNSMDMILVSSTHSKNILSTNNPNDNIHVLPERVNVQTNDKTVFKLKNDFNFLCMGAWLPGTMGNDRKNIPFTVQLFYAAFANHPNPPSLLLKTDQGTFSKIEAFRIKELMNNIRINMLSQDGINTLPEVNILHGRLSYEQMSNLMLHNNIKAYITLSHGEGFGRHTAEFLSTGKPIIASNWSGHKDFIKAKKHCNYLVSGELKTVDASVVNKYIVPHAKWYYPDPNDAIVAMQSIYEDYTNYLSGSGEVNIKKFNSLRGNKSINKLKSFIKTAMK